jgi:hypothetical protein
MRRTRYLILASGLIGLGSASCGTFAEECFNGVECSGVFGSGGAGATTSSTMTTASSTMTSTSTGMDPDCVGEIVEGLSDAESKRLISDKCGVFVQADATGGVEDGTQAAPYRSLQNAIDKAGNKRVYACSSSKMPYAEAVTVAAPLEVYGGFECGQGWVWKAATRSLITGAAQKVSLTLTASSEGAKIVGFKITSANATGKGESSVAVAVDDIDATLEECDVQAGDGAVGNDAAAPPGLALKGADAPPAVPGAMNACINPGSVMGGAPGMTTCDDGPTAGGTGGKGGIAGFNNGDGSIGAPGAPVDVMTGIGGPGQNSANLCGPGTVGKPGVPGIPGKAGASPGALTLSGPMSTPGADGTDGTSGSKAQGGGGGGAAKMGKFCTGNVDGNGASGGGGGAGGCGGKGGGGGKAGGSSIAIISLGTKLVLTSVTLKSGKGGDGGKGASGQTGGKVGKGGDGGDASGMAPSMPGCKGGDGGLGGAGGPGGGGRGGHSIGLAVLGTSVVAASTFTPGMPGGGGLAGIGGSPAGDGSQGLVSACWDFKTNKTCAK